MKKKQDEIVLLKKDDLILAWSLMENITVSIDQIFGTYAHGMDESGKWVDGEAYQSLCKALYDYCLEICEQTNKARMRLLTYLTEEEAEHLSEYKSSYWNYNPVSSLKRHVS
ncbi:hypothetical protein H8E77_17045 [bacterium]|nr:hypothetical protein [bacterium]